MVKGNSNAFKSRGHKIFRARYKIASGWENFRSKKLLSETNLPQIRIDGTRGGASMASATINALLRASVQAID